MTGKTYRTAVLISGGGTNLQALLDYRAENPAFPADIQLVLSNRPGVKGLERAQQANIPTCTVDHKSFDDRETFDAALQSQLDKADIDFVCLAGFMRVLTPTFVNKWSGRMLNIHPSLLPAFKGHRAHEQVIESTTLFSGCSVHVVTPDLDGGPIMAQAVVPRQTDDKIEDLSARVQKAEHSLYPWAVANFLRSTTSDAVAAPVHDATLFNLNPGLRIRAVNGKDDQ